MPAKEAPLVFHERWEQGQGFEGIKTRLSGRAVPIRSKAPVGVGREVYGPVLAYSVARRVMHDAAVVASQDPDRWSFIDSPRLLPGQLPESPAVSTVRWYQRLRRQELRPRRERWYARAISRKMSHRKKKRPEHRNPPPTKPFREAVVILL